MGKTNYLGFKKLLAFCAAVGLWVVSINFSYNGFKFDNSKILWFGVVLALVVTVVELVFNTKLNQLNPTLLAAGALCYAYGIYTNITGFYILQHGNLEAFFTGSNWLIPSFSGIIAEILPEALFAWGLGAYAEGDLVGNVVDVFGSDKPKNQQNQQPQKQKFPQQHQRKEHFRYHDEILAVLPRKDKYE